jgi:hypothetical protein
LILLFLKNKIRAVTLVSSPENTGKSGGKFPEIFPVKISRHFPEWIVISEFPEFPKISWENLTKIVVVHNIKIQY